MAAPTVSIVVADSALQAGETSLVTFTFSEAVLGFTNNDLSIANAGLTAVSSGDGGVTWTATLTPAAGITDATNLITLDKTGVTDAGSTPGVGATSSNNYAIDTARPTASVVVADNSLTPGQTSTVVISFSEPVSGFTNADLTVANGTLSAVMSSDGGATWMGTLTPTASLNDPTNVITLNLAGVTDAAGNTGSGSATSNNYSIGDEAPSATITVGDTSLTAGETTTVTFVFTQPVTGFTNADLTVPHGTLTALQTADNLTFTATLTPTAGVTAGANAITLDNHGFTNAGGMTGLDVTTSNSFAIDTAPPTAIIEVNGSPVGATVPVTIHFSEAVTGFSLDDLTAPNGHLAPLATTDNITFTSEFTPDASLTAANNAITLNGAGVTDAAGNPVAGTVASNNFQIDTSDVQPATTLPGTPTGDTIEGNDRSNMIVAGDGDDSVSAGQGDDTVSGDDGADWLHGNTGADSITGGLGRDTILGGQGDDTVQGNGGDDYLTGDKGDDMVLAGQGDEVANGGAGDDYVSGDVGSDTVCGEAGDDTVTGGLGDDVVYGATGDDSLSGDKGADTVRGGQGADVISGGDGADWL